MSDLWDRSTPVGADRSSPPATGLVVDLRDDLAVDPRVTGGKAAALARAAREGLAVLPGVVLTTAFAAAIDRGGLVSGHPAVAEAFQRVGGHGIQLMARSSSIHEDTASSSMAGQFESVGGI